MVPELEQTFRTIEEAREEARGRHEKLQVLDALWGDEVEDPGNPDHGEWRQHRRELREAVQTLESTVKQEILDRGLRFPAGGIEHGLVDFPSSYRGRWIYLCWERGDPELRFWHEVDGGYAGRNPITAEQARVMGRDDPQELDDSRLDF